MIYGEFLFPQENPDMPALEDFIADSLEKEAGFLAAALDGITPDELAWQPAPGANSIGWMAWHIARVEDMWIQFFIQGKSELWESDGWHERFGMPTRDNGFGHTAEQVAAHPRLDIAELLRYRAAVRDATLAYLSTVSADDWDAVPRAQRPEMSVFAIFRQIVGEFYQHVGQMAYLRGLQGKLLG